MNCKVDNKCGFVKVKGPKDVEGRRKGSLKIVHDDNPHLLPHSPLSRPMMTLLGQQLSGMMPAYYLLGTRGVVLRGWFGVRGRDGVWVGLRLGEQ